MLTSGQIVKNELRLTVIRLIARVNNIQMYDDYKQPNSLTRKDYKKEIVRTNEAVKMIEILIKAVK